MNRNSKYLERRPGELTLFAITFVGFVITAAGVILGSKGITATGFVLMFLALSCFLLSGGGEGD